MSEKKEEEKGSISREGLTPQMRKSKEGKEARGDQLIVLPPTQKQKGEFGCNLICSKRVI